jgi:fluoride exporter
MNSIMLWLGVGLLGGVAAIARFLVDALVSARGSGALPVGTLVVNLSGALLLGVLAGAAIHDDAYLLAGTATLGSYTTFSTWMFESQRLAEDGRRWVAALNVGASLVLGVAAVALGRVIGGL